MVILSIKKWQLFFSFNVCSDYFSLRILIKATNDILNGYGDSKYPSLVPYVKGNISKKISTKYKELSSISYIIAITWGFPCGSVIKNLPAEQET